MKKLVIRSCSLLMIVAFVVFLSNRAFSAETYPKREIRATWVASLGIDWPVNRGTNVDTKQKNQATQILDSLKAAGFNAVFFHVRPYADRVYSKNTWTDPKTGTKYTVAEPWSQYVSGTRGTGMDYDPLQYWIDEAHKRGMELHAWVNPYRIVTNLSHANDVAVQNWTISYNSKRIFNPALGSTIARIQNVCRVLTGNYDIDGIVFDDYFYPEGMVSDTSTGAPDYANYQEYKKNGGTLSIANWRRENVNKMVREVYATIKDIKPWVRFGISPAGAAGAGRKSSDGIPPLSDYCSASDWQYASIGSDPIAWMRDKSIDYISPQLYWTTTHSTNPFGPMSQWWSIVAQKFGRHFYASHSVSLLANYNTLANRQDILQQVSLNRTNTVDGNFGSIFYSTKNVMNTGLRGALGNSRFQKKALVPAMTWFDAPNLGTVANLRFSGTTLSWDAVSGQRYVVYAVPQSVTRTEAQSEDGGLRANYIVDITYSNTLAIPASQRTGYWYAVSIFDRYGNEWDIATVSEPSNVYEPAKDPTQYEDHWPARTIWDQMDNLWVRWPQANPIELNIELHRDMVARYEPSLGKDIVYVISRSGASDAANSSLVRFDGETGLEMKSIQLTYDSNWDPGYYPGNGIMLDDSKQLVTHTLTLPNGKVSVATVDASTGACTTMLSETSTSRIDHLDVYGTVAEGRTWYVIAPSANQVQRWTMNGKTVQKHETMDLPTSIGNASRVQIIDPDHFWLSGQGIHAGYYEFGNAEPLYVLGGEVEPGKLQATAVHEFKYDRVSYLFYQHNYADNKDGCSIQWSVAVGRGQKRVIEDAKHVWTLPEGGAGRTKMVSGDFGAPVSVVLPEESNTRSVNEPVRLYAYSSGNALVAYKMTRTNTTGVEDIVADQEDATAPIEWYTVSGVRVNEPTAGSIYIRRQGTKATKVKM